MLIWVISVATRNSELKPDNPVGFDVQVTVHRDKFL